MSLPSSTSLTFYGGVNEIGGNKILIQDKGTRILLDFGKSFKTRSKYYDWNENPRLVNGIGDFLVMGLLPDIDGVYRSDLLGLAGRSRKQDRYVDALFLSHAHSDHADYISFLREDIPLYMGETTKRILQSLEDERGSRLEFEITRYKQRPLERKADYINRRINTFTTSSLREKKIQVDSIEVEPVHVDHSIPGCYAFIIRTSTNTIIYSGDLRKHGNNPKLTQDFVQSASEAKPDVMLCEGTRIDETSSTKELDVFEVCKYFVEQARDHLVYADYSYKDIDRFTTFYNIAKSTERKLLIHPKVARYLKALSYAGKSLSIPSIDDDNILIYKPREKSGTYADRDYSIEDQAIYETTREKVWTASEVKKNPSMIIVALSSYQIDQLVDIVPADGLYLHSASEPFNEEGEIGEEKMSNWLKQFNLQRIHAHCSGHASGRDLSEIANRINPKTLIPIHTEHPRLFQLLQKRKVMLPSPMKQIGL